MDEQRSELRASSREIFRRKSALQDDDLFDSGHLFPVPQNAAASRHLQRFPILEIFGLVVFLSLAISPVAQCEETDLERRISRIAAQIDGVVGVAAVDLRTGRRVEVRAQERFPMASVYKFPLAVAVLSEVDAGKLRLDQKLTLQPSDFSLGHSPILEEAKGRALTLTVGRLIEAAVSESDNTAADFLMKVAGGPQWATRKIAQLGIEGIRIDRPENDIIPELRAPGGVARYAVDPRDTATPAAMAKLWELVVTRRDGLKPSSQKFLASVVRPSNNPVRIGRLLPKGTSVAHKTGTMPGTLNDTGAVTTPDGKQTIVIAIFTKGSSKSADQRTRVVAQIAKAIYDGFTR